MMRILHHSYFLQNIIPIGIFFIINVVNKYFNTMKDKQANKLDSFYEAQKVPRVVHFLRFYFSKMGWAFPKFSAKLFWTLFTTPKKRELKERHQKFYATAEQVRSFDVEGKEYISYTWGKGSKTVLLLHGWEGMAADWQLLVEAFLAAGDYKVIALDFPAHGNAAGKRSNMAVFIKGLMHLLPEIGHVHALIGHSLGANSAFFALERMKESAKVEHLVMLGSYPIPYHFFKTFQRFMHIPKPLFEKCVEQIMDMLAVDVRQLNMYEMRYNIPAKRVLLIHDLEDEVADIAKARALESEWDKVDLFSGNHGGHYRHFRHKDVIAKIIAHCAEPVEAAAMSAN
jgi:pimeloyl-ACP methyl ester carboxylesterase